MGTTEAVGLIELPETVTGKSDGFQLHPSLMDAALQTTMGLNASEDGQIVLPFALKELCIINELPTKVYAYAKHSEGVDPNGSVVKFDIDIADEAGSICVSLKEFTVRVFSHAEKEETGIFYAVPEWREDEGKSEKEKGKSELKNGNLFLLGVNKENEEKLKKELAELKVEQLIAKTDASSIIQNFQTVFKYIKDKLEVKPKKIAPVLVVIQGEANKYPAAMFSGLLKTARLENPKIHVKIVEVNAHETGLDSIIYKELEPETFEDVEIRYTEESKREVKKLKEVALSGEGEADKFIKESGVYWITGGMGGLGRIFVHHLSKTKDVKVILSGRSKLDKTKEEEFKELKDCGICLEYIQADVSCREDVEKVVRSIKETHNQLNGIIHSAGIVRDALIMMKTGKEIEDVFNPKVSGILNIDEVTKQENMDFIVLFSSISGVMGNAGQSDYSGANAFLDGYAEYRNWQVNQGKRNGKAVSINWPLWEDGGMGISEQSERLVKEAMGLYPLQTKHGLKAFDDALLLNCDQLIVCEGNIEKIEKLLFEQNKIVENFQVTESKPPLNTVANSAFVEEMTEYLKQLLSSTLKIDSKKIDLNAGLEKYGIDSIIVTDMTNQLKKEFGPLSKTLFFEYQTINQLSNYFIDEHKSAINKLFSHTDKIVNDENNISKGEKIGQIIELPALKRQRFVDFESGLRVKDIKNEDIAIIGISGRYPLSEDLNKFWLNLMESKNCIAEIPKERWDHNDCYDPDNHKDGKTHSRWGGFIEGVEMFDPLFFNISPKEAASIDPQERLFLETVWETLENGGYTRDSLNNKEVGVFVGSMYNHYHLMSKDRAMGDLLTISSSWSIANRVSYFFNFKGPSMAVNTACSSSLNAVYLACESIKRGEVTYAIAGGVNLSLHPSKWIALSQASMIGSDNKSMSLGVGDGYVPGEGVGSVLLKPLDEAINDNDQIYAVIKGGGN